MNKYTQLFSTAQKEEGPGHMLVLWSEVYGATEQVSAPITVDVAASPPTSKASFGDGEDSRGIIG